jgi:hypothetical protein
VYEDSQCWTWWYGRRCSYCALGHVVRWGGDAECGAAGAEHARGAVGQSTAHLLVHMRFLLILLATVLCESLLLVPPIFRTLSGINPFCSACLLRGFFALR